MAQCDTSWKATGRDYIHYKHVMNVSEYRHSPLTQVPTVHLTDTFTLSVSMLKSILN